MSLPGLTLLESETDTASGTMPSLTEFTLPDPSSVPEMRNSEEPADPSITVKPGDAQTSKLEGPEKQAQTLGEYKMCSMCNVYLNSKVQADMHYAGKLHQKKLRQKALKESLASTAPHTLKPVSQPDDATSPAEKEKPCAYLPHCDVCGVTFTGAEQVQTHLMGARHAKKLRQLAQKQKVVEVKEEPVNTSTAVSDGFYCKYCDVVCTGQAQLDQHFQGSKHKNVMNGAKQVASNDRLTTLPSSGDTTTPASIVFACPSCNVTANSEQQYLQHCSSVRHNNKLLNRPGKDKHRDHPYPNRRGARGTASNQKSKSANLPARGGGKWQNNSDYSQRSTFNSSSSSSSSSSRPRGGRGRGRGWGTQSNNHPNSSFSNLDTSRTKYSTVQVNFGGGYNGRSVGRGWSSGTASPRGGLGRGWQGSYKAASHEQEQWGPNASSLLMDKYDMPSLDSFVRESPME